MRKTILALAVLGATAGMAHAQSNVTIYGVIDTGFIKEGGTSARMGSNETSRIGFRGTEDLGNGLKATFQLEQRLNLNDGTNNADDDNANDVLRNRNNVQWRGASNIGLAGNFGAVRLGRVDELSTESYRRIDPFNQNSVGSAFTSVLRSEQISNTARYDSPVFSGVSAGVSYTLKADKKGSGAVLGHPLDGLNAGYAVSLKYDNGPIYAVANWNRAADSDKSTNWNLGAAYSFGDFKVSLGYEHTKLKTAAIDEFLGGTNIGDIKQKDWLVGLSWKLGPGEVKASYNRLKLSGGGGIDLTDDGDKAQRYSIGYTYNLSKRTAVYGVISHTKSDSKEIGSYVNTNGFEDDSVTAYQIGLNHKF